MRLINDNRRRILAIVVTARTSQRQIESARNREAAVWHRIGIWSRSVIGMSVPCARIRTMVRAVRTIAVAVISITHRINISRMAVAIVCCNGGVVIEVVVVKVVPVMVIRMISTTTIWIQRMITVHWIVRIERMITVHWIVAHNGMGSVSLSAGNRH